MSRVIEGQPVLNEERTLPLDVAGYPRGTLIMAQTASGTRWAFLLTDTATYGESHINDVEVQTNSPRFEMNGPIVTHISRHIKVGEAIRIGDDSSTSAVRGIWVDGYLVRW